MSYQCRLTFSIKNIKIDKCDGNELIAKLHFGDETIFALKENEKSKFSREITISFESLDKHLSEHLIKNAPKKLVVFRNSDDMGECKIDWIEKSLDEITKAEFQSSETELEYKIIKSSDTGGEKIVNGIVQLFISFTKSKTISIPRTTSFAFDAFGGTIEPEDLLCDLSEELKSSENTSILENERDYFTVDGNLINLNEIRDPCTNTKFANLAILAQYDLKKMMKNIRGDDAGNNRRFLKNIRAINPYSEGSLTQLFENNQTLDAFSYPPSDGQYIMDQYNRTACCTTNESGKFKNNICPNCLKDVSYESKELNCPLCECMKVSPKRTPKTPKTPVLVSMSEEFYTNRLPAATSGTRPRGCPCCVKNQKKCPDCMNYCKIIKDKRYNSSTELDIISQTSSLRSRLSMYGSLNNVTKSYANGSRRVVTDPYTTQKKHLHNRFYGDETPTSTKDSRRELDKPSSHKTGQRSSNGSDMIDRIPERRFKDKSKRDKRSKHNSIDNYVRMTSEERLAMLRKKLKTKRMARKKVSKRMQVKSRYSYCFGKKPPGFKIGHRECTRDQGLVPKNMGWLWNVPTLGINKLRLGWKPGAVTKPIKELMMHFLANYPCDTLPVTKPFKKSIYTELETSCPCDRSTLQVKKENGQYLICMNPLKDSKNLRPGENPYLSCPPIKFKIEKDAEQQKLDHCKVCLKNMGFCECTCSDPSACRCRTTGEKQLLMREMKRLSNEIGLQVPITNNEFTFNDDDQAENNVDIEFTPPSAAIGKKQKVVKKDTIATETQFNDKDFLLAVPGHKDLINVGKSSGKGDKVLDSTTKRFGKNAIGGPKKGPGADKGKEGKLGEKGTKSGMNKGNLGGKSGFSGIDQNRAGMGTEMGGQKRIGEQDGKKVGNQDKKGMGDQGAKGKARRKNGTLNSKVGRNLGVGEFGGGGIIMASNKIEKDSSCVVTDPSGCKGGCLDICCKRSCIQTPFFDPCCLNECGVYC